MRFSSVLSTLAALSAFTLVNGFATSVTYDNTYDNPQGSLSGVACSNGAHGLLTKGFTTFGSLPSFPFIGGAQAVTGWNSPNCGTCWALTYKGKTVNGKDLPVFSLNNYSHSLSLSCAVLAIDTAGNGFNIAQKALDNLTNGQAVALGRVDITATQVAASVCGL